VGARLPALPPLAPALGQVRTLFKKMCTELADDVVERGDVSVVDGPAKVGEVERGVEVDGCNVWRGAWTGDKELVELDCTRR